MPKELIPVLIQNKMIRDMYEELSIGWFRNELKPEGKPYYDDFIARIQRGEKISLSDYTNMFLGFDQKSGIKGIENLDGLEDKPTLVMANHTNRGPIGSGWKNVILSYHMEKITGKRMRLMHGSDPNARHDLFRERLHKSIDSILIRGTDPLQGALALKQAITNRDNMCLYPEGDGSKYLQRAKPESGRLIRICCVKGYNLVTVSFKFQNDIFFVTFDRIEKGKIATLEGAHKDKRISK